MWMWQRGMLRFQRGSIVMLPNSTDVQGRSKVTRTLPRPFSAARRMPCFSLLSLTKGPALPVPSKATPLVRFPTCNLTLAFKRPINDNRSPCLPRHSSHLILPLRPQSSIHILILRDLILCAQICPLLPPLGPHGLHHPLGLLHHLHLQLEQHSAFPHHLLCHIRALLRLRLTTLIRESRHRISPLPLPRIPRLFSFLSIIILQCSDDNFRMVRTTMLPSLPLTFLSWSCLPSNTLNSLHVPQFLPLYRVLAFGRTIRSYRDRSRANLSLLRRRASCWLVLVAGRWWLPPCPSCKAITLLQPPPALFHFRHLIFSLQSLKFWALTVNKVTKDWAFHFTNLSNNHDLKFIDQLPVSRYLVNADFWKSVHKFLNFNHFEFIDCFLCLHHILVFIYASSHKLYLFNFFLPFHWHSSPKNLLSWNFLLACLGSNLPRTCVSNETDQTGFHCWILCSSVFICLYRWFICSFAHCFIFAIIDEISKLFFTILVININFLRLNGFSQGPIDFFHLLIYIRLIVGLCLASGFFWVCNVFVAAA